MLAEGRILRDIINHYELAGAAHLVANGGFHPQLTARLKAQCDAIAHRAGNPPILGYARDCRKAQARRLTGHIENHRYGIDFGDGGQIRSKAVLSRMRRRV
jgi:hypothetical protein